MIVIINNISIHIGPRVRESWYACIVVRYVVIAKQLERIVVEREVLAFIFMELAVIEALIVMTCNIVFAAPIAGTSAVIGWLEFVLNFFFQSIVFRLAYQFVHDMVVAFTDEYGGDTDVGFLEMYSIFCRKTR